jgi:carboxylesterase type B
MGESAGAGSVRVLLGSPHAIGKFQGAVLLSNLGGGVSLGLNGNYATTYSSYLTIEESYARAGPQIFANLNCTQASLDEQIACLKKVPATTVVQTDPTARYVVQDGRYVNTPKLELLNNGAGVTACVPTIFGITAHDGASFSDYPRTPVSSQLEGIQIGLGISEAHAQSIIDSGLFPYYDTGNVTLDSFNVSQRVATDHQFRCIDQASVYAGTKTGAFKPSYYYQFERTTGGYDPNNLGGPPVTPGYPNGNPNLPYFKLHGADLAWVFGGISRFRDENDHKSIQLTTAYFAEFVKSGQPNPPIDYLKVRGYKVTLDAIQATGPWSPVSGAKGPIQLLDYPSRRAPFQDLEQCAFLKYPISYYLDGGR